MKTKNLFLCFSVVVLLMGFSSVVCAGTISGVLGGGVWDGWTQFQENDNAVHGGPREDWVDGNKAYPGYGGQDFDAEYLFYKREGNTLFLGLQTGFDIADGHVNYGGWDYYTGDIALSFNGPGTTGTFSSDSTTPGDNGFEYAIDFGLNSRDYGGHAVNALGGEHDPGGSSNDTDTAGLYEVSKWNNHVVSSNTYRTSNPFAMDGGTRLTDVSFNTVNSIFSGITPNYDTSYYRQVSFDISEFLDDDGSLWVDAHWTMSCGNDAINGSFAQINPGPGGFTDPVPEPATIALLGIGLAGLAGGAARRKWKKKAVDKS